MSDHTHGSAKSTVFVENDRVIVTEWRFPPGGHILNVCQDRYHFALGLAAAGAPTAVAASWFSC